MLTIPLIFVIAGVLLVAVAVIGGGLEVRIVRQAQPPQEDKL